MSGSTQPNGTKRLILDLRYVNNFLKRGVKYEDWKVAGYHHIKIHPDHLTFLGFAWKFPREASIRYFVFTVLPFGLSSAQISVS